MTAGWVITLIASVVAYVVLMACVYPYVLLKTELVIRTPRDRGIKNVIETTGRTIVYQPGLEYRKYLPQYLISERNGKKILLCKLTPDVKYIDYDVITYDGFGRVRKVINAKELIDEVGYTQKMPLSRDVAYVSIVVNEVNDSVITQKKNKPITKWKIAGYSIACILTTVFEIFLIKLCCSSMFGGVFRESFMIKGESIWLTVGIALGAALVNLAFVVVAIGKNNRWKLMRGED